MPNCPTTARPDATGPQPFTDERRTHPHLRELCDEVIASFQAAADSGPISAEDRAAARAMLATVAPLAQG